MGVVHDCGGSSDLDNPPFVYHGDAIRKAGGLRLIVGRHQGGRFHFLQVAVEIVD